MAQDSRSLPEGAGATIRAEPATDISQARLMDRAVGFPYHRTGTDIVVAKPARHAPSTATVVAAAVAGAIAGGALPFMLARRSSTGIDSGHAQPTTIEEAVIIARPARDLYDFWRDFSNLPRFMDNIKSVQMLGGGRSHWVIKAPVGTKVEFDSRIVEDVPGRVIAWESEPGATIPNRGRVEFIETAAGGATNVRTRISYDPPAGAVGRIAAKLFRREPEMQAREDLHRLKEIMESGRSAD